MEYLKAISDKKFISEFSEKLEEFHAIEVRAKDSLPRHSMGYGGPSQFQKVVIKNAGEMDANYPILRDYLSRNMKRLISIARKHSISADLLSYPAPAVGGPVIEINIFDAVLENNSHGDINFQTVHDKLQAVIGACSEHERLTFFALINPFHWFKKLLFYVLRIPFILIEATGFDVEKFENNAGGHIAKGLTLIFVIWFLIYWLGFSKEDIVGIIESLP